MFENRRSCFRKYKDKDYIKYPYMDTLKIYYPDDGVLVSPLGSSMVF
jgi:hypothetical protein